MLEGGPALLFVVGLSFILSVVFGWMVAALLNRAKGKEMIVSIMVGQLSSVIYQSCLWCLRHVFESEEQEIIRGSGESACGA